MNLFAYIKRALGVSDEPQPQPAMAQITIISTQSVKGPSGTRPPRSSA